MKKAMALTAALVLALSLGTAPAYAAEAISVEEQAAALAAANGGAYSASDEAMTMAELSDMLINAYKLDAQYVSAMGDMDVATPDSAFFDFGGGGDPEMPFMRGNLAYVITKLYGLSLIPIDAPDAWKHLEQTGYAEVDGNPMGYPGNKEAIYTCRQLGVAMPQVSDTELGFGEPVTKAEFAAACYSALGVQSQAVTRGQAIAALCEALAVEPVTSGDNFADAEGSPYKDYLAAAKQHGITAGVGDNLYAPDLPISMQNFYLLCYKTLEHKDMLPENAAGGKSLSDYPDIGQVDPWALDAMTKLAGAGLTADFGGMLTPKAEATRGAVAKVMYGVFVR